jgi:hypothetical protein
MSLAQEILSSVERFERFRKLAVTLALGLTAVHREGM